MTYPVNKNGTAILKKETAPKTEVVPKAKRRKFSGAYKLRIVQEADQCSQPGEVGALLRREGLYSSHLTDWRRQVKAGQLQSGSDKKRGRKALQSELEKEKSKLERENERLKQKLAQAEVIMAAQKKLALLLEQIAAQPAERS